MAYLQWKSLINNGVAIVNVNKKHN